MKIAALLLVAAIGCDQAMEQNACQGACDVTTPGTIGVSCEPAGRCVQRAAGDMGSCLCTTTGSCGSGWVPWTPDPSPVATVCGPAWR